MALLTPCWPRFPCCRSCRSCPTARSASYDAAPASCRFSTLVRQD